MQLLPRMKNQNEVDNKKKCHSETTFEVHPKSWTNKVQF